MNIAKDGLFSYTRQNFKGFILKGLRVSCCEIRFCFKAPKYEYIFPKYCRNLNVSEIFRAGHEKNNFPILFPK